MPGTRIHYCPDCKKPLQRRVGKRGPFWGCTDFPRCRRTLNDVEGKPGTAINAQYRCPVCTRQMIRADASRGDYWFCSGYGKGCKVTLADHEGAPEAAYQCRDCGNALVKRRGKHGMFWGCRGYPDCTASFRDIDNRPDFDFFLPESS